MNIQSQFITVEGVETHYLEAGSGEEVLVLIHGGGAGADAFGNWNGCFAKYAENFRVIAVDMIGFGKSAKPAPEIFDYSQDMRNTHMTSFIEQISGGKAVCLIGNSMGGATAIGVALSRPELIKKLVLMGAAGLDISNPDPVAKKILGSYDYTFEGMKKIVSTLVGSRFQVNDDLVAYRHKLTLEPGVKEALSAIYQSVKEKGMTYAPERIATIRIPTLVVGGKEDQIATMERTNGFLELIPNSYGFVIPHAGHWVMIEAPEEFISVTEAFFLGDAFTG